MGEGSDEKVDVPLTEIDATGDASLEHTTFDLDPVRQARVLRFRAKWLETLAKRARLDLENLESQPRQSGDEGLTTKPVGGVVDGQGKSERSIQSEVADKEHTVRTADCDGYVAKPFSAYTEYCEPWGRKPWRVDKDGSRGSKP